MGVSFCCLRRGLRADPRTDHPDNPHNDHHALDLHELQQTTSNSNELRLVCAETEFTERRTEHTRTGSSSSIQIEEGTEGEGDRLAVTETGGGVSRLIVSTQKTIAGFIKPDHQPNTTVIPVQCEDYDLGSSSLVELGIDYSALKLDVPSLKLPFERAAFEHSSAEKALASFCQADTLVAGVSAEVEHKSLTPLTPVITNRSLHYVSASMHPYSYPLSRVARPLFFLLNLGREN